MSDARIEPPVVVEQVETFVRQKHHEVRTSSNVTLLDEGQVWDLHTLAARIYALGFKDGEHAEGRRRDGVEQRRRDREDTNA